MWSLPDINRLNERARGQAGLLDEYIGQQKDADGEPAVCEWKDFHRPCKGPLYVYKWYDIFSDDPKGLLWLCEEHDGYSGQPSEGYFTCDGCGRVFAENYTWERYAHYDAESGETLCLNDWRERYLAEPEHWIDLTPEGIEAFRQACAEGKKPWLKAPHLLAVGQESEDYGLSLIGNLEFDSMSGQLISGFSSTTTRDPSDDFLALLHEAAETGAERAVLILDAGYQFAVSIGVYVETAKTGAGAETPALAVAAN